MVAPPKEVILLVVSPLRRTSTEAVRKYRVATLSDCLGHMLGADIARERP